jgi:hypothetical protein
MPEAAQPATRREPAVAVAQLRDQLEPPKKKR